MTVTGVTDHPRPGQGTYFHWMPRRRHVLPAITAFTVMVACMTAMPWRADASVVTTVNCSTSGSFTITDNIVTGQQSCVGSAVIPTGVTSVADQAFDWDSALTSLTLPNSLQSIGWCSFRGTSLTTLVIPNSVTTMADCAFSDVPLTALTIGTGLTRLATQVFTHAHLSSVTIPSNITELGYGAFQWGQLQSVTMPATLTTIGERAFEDNQLTSVTIGTGVSSIGAGAFSETTGSPLSRRLGIPILRWSTTFSITQV